MAKNGIDIITMNVRGLRSTEKRQKTFEWINQHKYKIICVQESHSSVDIEKKWKSEFGGDIIFAHGKSNALGVMIMFKSNLHITMHKVTTDPNGRFVIIDMTLEEKRLTLCNVYGPNNDDSAFFENLYEQIENITNDNRIIVGDFNHILNPLLDKKGGRLDHANVKARSATQQYIEECDMVDIYRTKYPKKKVFYISHSPS